MSVATLGTTSITFTTTNVFGEWERVTLMRSTIRVLLGSVAHDDGQGEMEALPFLKLAVNAEPITEEQHLALRKLIDLAIDAVEAGTTITWATA